MSNYYIPPIGWVSQGVQYPSNNFTYSHSNNTHVNYQQAIPLQKYNNTHNNNNNNNVNIQQTQVKPLLPFTFFEICDIEVDDYKPIQTSQLGL